MLTQSCKQVLRSQRSGRFTFGLLFTKNINRRAKGLGIHAFNGVLVSLEILRLSSRVLTLTARCLLLDRSTSKISEYMGENRDEHNAGWIMLISPVKFVIKFVVSLTYIVLLSLNPHNSP